MWNRQEMNRRGLDDAAIVRQTRAGVVERVRRGVYDVPSELSPEDAHRRLIEATVPLLKPGSVLSHHSAGVMHGLPVPRRALDRVAVSRVGDTGTCVSGSVSAHRRAAVACVVVDGHRVTTLAQTAVDLACRAEFLQAVAILDAALHRGARLAEIEQVLRGARRVGNPLVRQALWSADGRSESVGESHSRVLMTRLGLPAPQLQFLVSDSEGTMRADFAWPSLGVVGEFDGKIKYGRLLKPGQRVDEVMEAERAREVRLERLGWMVVRWVWSDLQDPKRLDAKLRRALTPRAA